jgi:hypothetical protein
MTTTFEALERVRRSTGSVALILPHGFGESAGRSLFRPAAAQPRLQLGVLFDPSRTAEVGMVRGIFTEHAMQAVCQEMFSGATGRQNLRDMLAELDSSSMPADTKAKLRTMLASILACQATAPAQSSTHLCSVLGDGCDAGGSACLQRVILLVSIRWAIDGLDSMTWRGRGLSGAIAPTLILLGFAAAFATIAVARFRGEEA